MAFSVANSEAPSESPSEAYSESYGESRNESDSELYSESASEACSELYSEADSESPSESPSESYSEASSELISGASSEARSEADSELYSESASELISGASSESCSEARSELRSEARSEASSELYSESPSEKPRSVHKRMAAWAATGPGVTQTNTGVSPARRYRSAHPFCRAGMFARSVLIPNAKPRWRCASITANSDCVNGAVRRVMVSRGRPGRPRACTRVASPPRTRPHCPRSPAPGRAPRGSSCRGPRPSGTARRGG